jgi:CO/xanthine dehydrogenase FAD-binding subunit
LVHPLVREAISQIAHPQIRNRGTIGGSLAHADPSAELPAVAVALAASLQLRGPGGVRTVGAVDFFDSYYTTVINPDEVLVSVHVPLPVAREGWAILEVARRRGDFAIAGVAVRLVLDEFDAVSAVSVVPLAMSDRPVASTAAEQALLGRRPTDALLTEAARATAAETDPASDVHATSAYRRRACTVLTERALAQALALAAGTKETRR